MKTTLTHHLVGPAPDKEEKAGMEEECPNSGPACGMKPSVIVALSREDKTSSFDTNYSGDTMRFDPDVVTSPIWQWRNTLCTL